LIKLKSISEILDKEFVIPSYQRGYRWGTEQVKDLLEDILEFANKKKVEKEFYCLQPVVVRKDEKDKYIIIDGQQRLTTIFLILKYFNDVEFFKRPKPIYELFFVTRKDSEAFLKELSFDNFKVNSSKNIDYFYICNTFIVLDDWFNSMVEKDPSFIHNFYSILLHKIKIIWYEIQDESEIDIFTRLNSGKIPLTPSELIKALFLLDKKEENEKLLLASQWDEIEYKLQDENFFAFINKDEYKKATRIEFIFDLIADKKKIEIDNLRKEDRLRSFYIFNELISEPNIDLWDEVKTYFRIFEELYNDNTYYHLVGYLVNTEEKIEVIVNDFKENSKDIFLKKLKDKIQSKLDFKNKTLKELTYEDDDKLISNILFLFNVLVTIEANYSRYPFDRHKSEKWSLEHIHAQNSKNLDEGDKKELLRIQKSYIKDNEFKQKIEDLEKDNLDEALDEISKFFGDNSSIHTIDNLALLSRDDNSSLNHSVFPIKRDRIKKLNKDGSFIPLGTKNVFLKYYSNNVKETIKWSNQDREAYLEVLKETLSDYIGVEK